MARFLSGLLLFGLVAPAAVQEVVEDTPPAQDAAELTAEFRAQAQHMMLQYSFALPEEPDVEIEFVPEPLMYWTNPIAGNWEGVVYLWTAGGRPAVIGSPLHQADRRKMAHEFHQLTTTRVTGMRNGELVWRTSEPGVTWAPVAGADSPATTLNARGFQMRTFAHRFTAEKIGPDDVRREMRLLPRYVYRYEVADGSDVIDGACFIMTQTTDPEIVLLLEARKTGEDESEWHYALARLNQHQFFISYDGEEVHQFPFVPFPQRSDPEAPYTKLYNQLYQELP